MQDYFTPLLKNKKFILGITSLLLAKTKSLTEEQKVKWEESFILRTSRYEPVFEQMIIDYWEQQKKQILANMKSVKTVRKDLIDFYMLGAEEWDVKLTERGKKLITEIMRREGISIEEALFILAVSPAGATTFNVNSPFIAQVIEADAFAFASGVNATSVTKLKETLIEGILAGEGMNLLRDRVRDEIDSWSTIVGDKKTRAAMIARTEVIRASNRASNLVYKLSGVVDSKEWLTTKDDRACVWCLSLDGKYVGLDENFFNLGDSLTVDGRTLNFDYSDVDGPPAHVSCRCFVDGQIPIYTSKGNKKIRDIIVGDLVLTHKGRFRKVTQLHRNIGKAGTSVVDIQLMNKKFQFSTLTLTANHPVLLDGKWQESEKAKIGDKLNILANMCKRCKKLIPSWKKYCSHSCQSLDITDRQWASKEHRENISKKTSAQLKREYANGTRDPHKITEKANKKTRELVKEGKHSLQQEWVRRLGSSKMGQKGFMSGIEQQMKAILDDFEVNYITQMSVKQFFVDFGLPEYKIAIEVDGLYWHQDKEKDLRRQREIEAEGWFVLRFDENEMKYEGDVSDEVGRILANHNGEYSFMDAEIVKVNKWNLKSSRRLYNFSVEEDESYIAKGFVVHNCTTIPRLKEVYMRDE